MVLRSPATAPGRAGLTRVLAAPGRTLFATDFDGTLSPIVDDPAQANAHPETARVLGRLGARLAGVAVVSGRPVTDVLRLGGLEGAEGLAALRVLGQYGHEHWDPGTGTVAAPPPHRGIAQARDAVPDLLRRLGLTDVHVEDKGRALGLHVRRSGDPVGALARLRDPLAELAEDLGLVVEPGKQVLELRPPGTDKGAAVTGLVADVGADTVVYAGDDLGDLAAYDAVEALRAAGGSGLLLCVVGADRTALEPRADLVLDGPGELLGWLDALADALVDAPADRPADPSTRPGAAP